MTRRARFTLLMQAVACVLTLAGTAAFATPPRAFAAYSPPCFTCGVGDCEVGQHQDWTMNDESDHWKGGTYHYITNCTTTSCSNSGHTMGCGYGIGEDSLPILARDTPRLLERVQAEPSHFVVDASRSLIQLMDCQGNIRKSVRVLPSVAEAVAKLTEPLE